MKKLLTIAVLGLSLSGFALADDGAVPDFKSTMGQSYDGTTLGRAGHPEPIPTTGIEGLAGGLDSSANALSANG